MKSHEGSTPILYTAFDIPDILSRSLSN